MSANLMQILGGRQVFGARADHVDLLAEIERGLPIKAYERIAHTLALSPEEEDRLLQVSLRTRARWKHRSRLDPAVSDRVARLGRILGLAEEVLENRSHAVAWLREPSDSLGARTPLEILATDAGAEKVSNLLYQMEHGLYA